MRGARLFVLGGNDAEMEVIKGLLSLMGEKFAQPQKDWGDHKYSPENLGYNVVEKKMPFPGGPDQLRKVLEEGPEGFVFVECQPSGWQDVYSNRLVGVTVIDHHGETAGYKPAIQQVLDLLGRENFSQQTIRWAELIGANDAGYVPAMSALGATAEEIKRIRALDRSAQGITPEQEKEAERAIDSAEISGRLTIIRMAHSKCATVTDRLYGQYDQLLILSEDGEVNFYGDGALCTELQKKFEGWNGGLGLGKKGEAAFWGGYPAQNEVKEFIIKTLAQ